MKIYHAIVLESLCVRCSSLAHISAHRSAEEAREAILQVMSSHAESCPGDICDTDRLSITDPRDDRYYWEGYIMETDVVPSRRHVRCRGLSPDELVALTRKNNTKDKGGPS